MNGPSGSRSLLMPIVPSEEANTNPINPALNELIPANIACTFVRSATSLLSKSLASGREISVPPDETMLFHLIDLYGFFETRHWTRTLGLESQRAEELLRRLVFGKERIIDPMKPEYHEGPEAAERFDKAAAKVFRAPKSSAKPVPKKQTVRKAKKASKG